MAELDCDCQLSRNIVGARERVLMSALRALEEGFDEMYGPGSTASERLREVQDEVLDGREWSLLKVRQFIIWHNMGAVLLSFHGLLL